MIFTILCFDFPNHISVIYCRGLSNQVVFCNLILYNGFYTLILSCTSVSALLLALHTISLGHFPFQFIF